MTKNRRTEILSLNLREIKKSLPSALQTKFIVSKDNQDNPPLPQNVIKPWMLSLSNETFVSRNKVGNELLYHCRHGFLLDDPYIRKTRFYVDYHRMHDPGLKSYYNRIPVRNRLKKLELVTTDDDAICTNKEFMDYIRYLDSNISYNLIKMKEIEKKRRLSKHFRIMKSIKEQESLFCGIFKRRRHISEAAKKARLDQKRLKLNHRKIAKKGMQAMERRIQFMREISIQLKERHQAKLDRFRPRLQMINQNEIKKRIELVKIINGKLHLAKSRRECLVMEKKVKKMNDQIDHCKRHAALRQEILLKNIKMYQLYEEEQRKNIENRKEHMNKLREKSENRAIKLRREIAKKELNGDVVEKILKNIELMKAKYIESVHQVDLDEVRRRIALLTKPFIAECVEIAHSTLIRLGILVSAAVLVAKTRRIIELRSIIIPEIGASKCVLIRQRVAEFISLTINYIKKERLEAIKEDWKRQKIVEDEAEAKAELDLESNDQEPKDPMANRRLTVVVDASKKVIGQSAYSEFIGNLTQIWAKGDHVLYKLSGVIEREMERCFQIICENKFEFSTKFETRDWVHTYPFQKYLIFKSIRRLMEYVKIKQQHFWTRRQNIHKWRSLDLNLADISFEAANIVMNFPNQMVEFCESVEKISKFLCIQLSDTLEEENMKETDSTDDYERRNSFLSETGTS